MLVRIMTSNARDARIVRVMTAAIEHPVRLKTNVVDSRLARQKHRLFETRVTRPTKRLRQLVRAETAGVENLWLFEFLLLHRNQVFLAWSMTRLASYTRTQALQLQ